MSPWVNSYLGFVLVFSYLLMNIYICGRHWSKLPVRYKTSSANCSCNPPVAFWSANVNNTRRAVHSPNWPVFSRRLGSAGILIKGALDSNSWISFGVARRGGMRHMRFCVR